MWSRSKASRKRCAKSLGEAFVHEGGVQCGFCIPGIVVRASSMMRARTCTGIAKLSSKALDGHLCRCTGYARILDAIQTAGEAWKNGRERFRCQRSHGGIPILAKIRPDRNPDSHTQARQRHGKSNGIRNRRFASRYRGIRAGAGRAAVRRRHARAGHAARRSGAERASASQGATRSIRSEALAMPGVVRIFTAADVPGQRGTGLTIIRICRSLWRSAKPPAASAIFWPWWWRIRRSMRARRRTK